MAIAVTPIPATKSRFASTKDKPTTIRRVAGYARVSTDKDEQFTSFEAQVDYYTRYIKDHKDWEFVNVYTDEGISGTSTEHRAGFNSMIEDGKKGKIDTDFIITKLHLASAKVPVLSYSSHDNLLLNLISSSILSNVMKSV